MSTDLDNLEYKIAKLDLARGDILVVKVDSFLTKELAAHARDYISGLLPRDRGIHVLIIDKQTDLSVMTAAEIEALKLSDHQ